jgi:hypothetical protein
MVAATNSDTTGWLVTADPPFQETLRETLSEVDEWLSRASHWLGFSLRFNSALDPEILKTGLERTLRHIPALGARVDTTSSKLYELVLEKNNQGVVLEYTKRDDDAASLPDDSSPREAWKQAGLDAPAAGFQGEPGITDPLMRVRLTSFADVSFLSIGISHGLCDGSGISDILQTWSHFCTHATTEGLPETLKRPRAFGHRVTVPYKPAKDLKELQNRVWSDVGCSMNPLSKWTFYLYLLPRVVWCMSRQQVLELRIDASRLQQLKEDVTAKLPTDQWVSRFEVLCAALLVAQRSTASDQKQSTDHMLHVACNLRGRAERFPNDYFGNASFDYRHPISLPFSASYDLDAVTEMAQEIHRAVRTGLEDPQDICKTKDWFEAARHLGYRNTYDVWAPVVLDAVKGDGTFVNSWDRRWLEVSMGSSQQAVAMAAFFGVISNLIVQVPRDRESGDSTIYFALPASHAKRFRAFCQESKDMLSFHVVESKE